MGRYEVQDGLVHFVFANEDTYYLDSMIRLNKTDYIYYELKKEHFSNVLFISGCPAYSIRVFDENSFELCMQQSGIFGKGFWKGKKENYQAEEKGVYLADYPVKKLLGMLKNASNTAFVFDISSFSEIFQDRAEELRNLQKSHSHRKNLILLQSSVIAEDSFSLLTKKDGIFQRKMGQEFLFPEIVSAFYDEESVSDGCYIKMKKRMGKRCVFLNCFTASAIRNVAKWVSWFCGKNEALYGKDIIDNISEFVDWWYHSVRMREKYRGLLRENERRLFSELGKDLNYRWANLAAAAQEWRKSQEKFEYIEDIGVLSYNSMVIQLKSMHFPKQYEAEQRQMHYEWLCVREKFYRPYPVIIRESLEKILNRCIHRMDQAISKNDLGTFQRAEECLDYAVKTGFLYEQDHSHIWDCYDKIGELSENVFDLNAQIHSDRQNILQWDTQLTILEEEINTNKIEEEFERHRRMDQAITLDRRIQIRKSILSRNNETYISFLQVLTKLEDFMKTVHETEFVDVEDILRECSLMMSNYHTERKTNIHQLEEDMKGLDELLMRAESTGVEEEYARMRCRHKEKNKIPLPEDVRELVHYTF